MAAKTIQEAIRRAMQLGPMSDFETRCIGEIRDFAAHVIASYQLKTLREHADNAELRDQIAIEVFLAMFPPDKGAK